MKIRHLLALSILSAFIGLWGINASAAETPGDDRLTPNEPTATCVLSMCMSVCKANGFTGGKCVVDG